MAENAKKILLSGVKPTGRPHIGNYFGAMRQFVELSNQYQVYAMIADYHALIDVRDAKTLQQDTLDLAIDYLAIGLDPEKVVLFKQSDVPEHTELTWIFNCLVTVPYLQRAHAYKDAVAKEKEVNVGLFEYPILMAADILMHDPDVVPVGEDNRQHIEMTREIAEKFNHHYGETFKSPKELILPGVKTVPGIDGRKMSKSYNNHIPLFSEDAEIKKLVMSIVTDSKGVEEVKDSEKDNVFALHKLFSTETELQELARRYKEGKIGYKESKELLANKIIAFVEPLREKRNKLKESPDYVLDILKKGGEKARANAKVKMETVREKIGLKLY